MREDAIGFGYITKEAIAESCIRLRERGNQNPEYGVNPETIRTKRKPFEPVS